MEKAEKRAKRGKEGKRKGGKKQVSDFFSQEYNTVFQ